MIEDKIIYLLKIFQKKEHLDDFLNGKLYMRKLSYFQTLEGDYKNNRGDENEGVCAWLQPNKTKITIGEMIINEKDLVSPVKIQKNQHKNCYIFCLYAGHMGDIQASSKLSTQEQLNRIKVNDECLKLGGYCVIIRNPTVFLNRVKNSMVTNDSSLSASLVEYYDPAEFHGCFKSTAVPFKKSNNYSHQNEYRICLNSNDHSNEAYILDIGSIQDIANGCKTTDINSKLYIDNNKLVLLM